MGTLSKESRILLAIQALKNGNQQSVRSIAKIYNVDRMTLQRRMNGQRSRRDTPANSRKLTDLEESVLVREILDLASRAFPPRLSGVEDMANRLLADRDASRVGPRWASNFVKRQPQLRTRFTRQYDYQRALCEDPAVIGDWFRLVRNVVAKYGIHESDIWNFDETGFMMGVISSAMVVTTSDGRGKAKMTQPGNREWATVIQGVNAEGWAIPPFIIVAGQYHLSTWYRDSPLPSDWVVGVTSNGWTTNELGLEWIKHFDKHSRSRTKGSKRLLVLDGHESHHSAEFEHYCKENDIITLCMPAHSSHLLQPLDVGCFGPLKRAYGKEIENLVRAHINHITKVEFLSAFKDAFFAAFGEENVRAGFRGSGLVPLNPDTVISKLDVKLRTPTPTGPPPTSSDPWISKTPQNPIEATSQSEFIKSRIAAHQNSSPTSIYGAIDQIVKGTKSVMHTVALLKDRVTILEEANRTLSKRRRQKKTFVRQGGTLTLQEASDLLDQKDIEQQLTQEVRTNGGSRRRTTVNGRRCGNCGKPGHNARTCQEDREMSDLYSSE
jgi:hypothetical protein